MALSGIIGTGTSTVELADLQGCDMLVLVGANPASNHPRLIHQLQAIREREAERERKRREQERTKPEPVEKDW